MWLSNNTLTTVSTGLAVSVWPYNLSTWLSTFSWKLGGQRPTGRHLALLTVCMHFFERHRGSHPRQPLAALYILSHPFLIAPLFELSLLRTSWKGLRQPPRPLLLFESSANIMRGAAGPAPPPPCYFLDCFTAIELPSYLNHHFFDPVNPPATV